MERVHYGVHAELEAAADEILRQAVATVPRSQKMDVLTPWKERDRLSKEVYTAEGVPDPAVRSGMYNRVWNPRNTHLNSRDGHTQARRTDEISVYLSEEAYRDRAGRVFNGRLRLQTTCRRLTWGRVSRLQCPPCRRYLPVGNEVVCSKCGTTYISEEVYVV